jgi:hypothetical protein
MVVSYDFVWAHEHAKGRLEGVKPRPACIVVAIPEADGAFTVTYAPITTKEPAPSIVALELPEYERRQLRLTAPRCWVILHELNEDQWPYGLEQVSDGGFVHGKVSDGFLRQILRLCLSTRARVIARE